jgi:HEAT repeat protein
VVDSTDEACAALKAIDPYRRREAALYLADHPGPAATEALFAALGDPDPQAHEAVILALVQQSVPDKVARLVTVLREDSAARRNAAISVLIEIGTHDIANLTSAFQHPSAEVRLHIAEVLGDLRDPQAVPALLARLTDDAEFPNVRHAAAQALGKIGDRTATPALIGAAERGDFWVRYAAVEALGRLGDERAVGPLLQLMQQDIWTRPTIVHTLGNLESLAAVEALVAALDDANEAVRVASMEALIKIVIEPGTVRRADDDRLAEVRRLIPLVPLRRELQTHSAPNSAYAAHLLGWLAHPSTLPDLIAALGDADETLRYAAVEAIMRYGHTAIPSLLEALENPAALIRENAAELLGMLANASVVPALLARLSDEDTDVRQAILRALGALGGEAAYEGLLRALDDPTTRDTALGVLGQLRDTSPSSDLKSYLQTYLYQGKPETRWAAAQALSLFGDEVAVSMLLNATRLLDDTIRQPAAEALARVRGSRAVGVLIEALGDRDWLVRQKAVEALSSIPDGRAVAALLPLAHDPEWRVRKALVVALGRIQDARIYEPLQILAQDPDRWIRRTVMDVCARLDDSRAADILLRGLEDAEADVRAAALTSLGLRRDPATAPEVARCLTDSDLQIRAAGTRAITQIGGPAAVESVGLLAHDPAEHLRLEAAQALGDLGSDEGIGALEVLLQDEAAAVRRGAAQALAHLGTVRAAEALVAALRHPSSKWEAQAELRQMGDMATRALLGAARHAEPEIRAVAAETLGQLGSLHAVPILNQLLRDTDARVRQAAEASLKLMGADERRRAAGGPA